MRWSLRILPTKIILWLCETVDGLGFFTGVGDFSDKCLNILETDTKSNSHHTTCVEHLLEQKIEPGFHRAKHTTLTYLLSLFKLSDSFELIWTSLKFTDSLELFECTDLFRNMTMRKVNSRLQQLLIAKKGRANSICCDESEFNSIGWSLIWGKYHRYDDRASDIFLGNKWSCRKTSYSSTLTNHLNSIIPWGFKITSSMFKRGCWLEMSKQPFSWDKTFFGWQPLIHLSCYQSQWKYLYIFWIKSS